MTSPRPDGATAWDLASRTVFKGLDFWAALVVGVVVYFLLLGRSDVDGATWLLILGAASATLAGVVWLSERWLFDKVTGTPYGEMLSAIDPDSRALFLPFAVIRYVGMAAAVTALVSSAFVDTLGNGALRSLAYAIPAFLAAWTLFGVLDLMRVTGKHMRQMRRIEGAKLEAERRLRERRSKGDGS